MNPLSQSNSACGGHVKRGCCSVGACVVGRDGDHRHLVGDECQRAVFQFICGLGHGVDGADLLQLLRTFLRNRVVQATAQEGCVFFAGEVFASASVSAGTDRRALQLSIW